MNNMNIHRFSDCSVEGQTQVKLSRLLELAGEKGCRVLIAHMHDIKESVPSRQFDR